MRRRWVQYRYMDSMSVEQRSKLMAQIHGKDTKPELLVRRLLHVAGYRYQLQGRIPYKTAIALRQNHPGVRLPGGKLPGRPDVVFSARRKVVFVNGCFWHLHDCPGGQHAPRTHAEFWKSKRTATQARDQRNAQTLRELGWESLVLWECQLKDTDSLHEKLSLFLGPPSSGCAKPAPRD